MKFYKKITQLLSATQTKPITEKWVIRLLITTIIALAFLAGYYQTSLEAEKKRYLRLEDMYVRVRGELGREETQRLIDLSREKQIDN